MNAMRGSLKLAAYCAGLLVLATAPAWAQPEELWLETRSAAPVPSQMVLKKGRPYLLTMQGTYTVWGNNVVPGEKSGKPEPAPMFPSPGVATRSVVADPEFFFAGVRAPGTAPQRSNIIQISLDGGKTWKHPASTAPFNATDHKYGYELMGEDSALQVRITDKPIADNSGRVKLVVLPAEELWLETRSGAPVLSQMVLKKGTPYRVTMQGTYTVWPNNIVPGEKSGQPKPAPMFPSPGIAPRNVGLDPEFVFAGAKAPGTAPVRDSLIQVSVDGGKTWKHPASTAPYNATDHRYTYELMGEDTALQVRFADKIFSDNSGRVQIFLLPGI